MSTKKIRKKYASDPQLLPEIEKFFIKVFKGEELPEERYNALILALSEASSNAIKHGNKSDSSKAIEIEIEIDEEKIDVKIKDEGEGFDPSAIPNPTDPENILKESGRGLFIINSFVDELNYEFLPEGTITHLRMYRNND